MNWWIDESPPVGPTEHEEALQALVTVVSALATKLTAVGEIVSSLINGYGSSLAEAHVDLKKNLHNFFDDDYTPWIPKDRQPSARFASGYNDHRGGRINNTGPRPKRAFGRNGKRNY